MSDNFFKKIQLPDGSLKYFKNGIYPVIGTQTATTAAWTGSIDVPELYDGLTIAYYLPRTSANNVTLKLTLSDGSETPAIPVYFTGTTRLTTHYAAGSTVLLTYWSEGSIEVNGVATTEDRWTHSDYNYNSDTWRNITVNSEAFLGTSTSSGAVNFIDGKNVTIDTGNGGGIVINASEEIVVSQAEYDALGPQKKYNGKSYYVYDAEYPVDEEKEETIIYGWSVDPEESDPSAAITYLQDAAGMTPAAMGSSSFNYGSWENAFFMPKPCMLKYDGTVDYYLNPNDYSLKANGEPSDIDNLEYEGNAMMEWPLIWYKYEENPQVEGGGYFYCSNQKVDDSYQCWSNYDAEGNVISNFYTSIYNGIIYDGQLRSISGYNLTTKAAAYSATATYAVGKYAFINNRQYKCVTAVTTPEAFDETKWIQMPYCGSTTGQQEVDAALENNITDKSEWYTDVLADRMLINGLLILVSKSLNTQNIFGNGIQGGSQSYKDNYVTGSLNDKGLFYGNTSSNTIGVKVFGMENWWGCVWRRTAGLVGITGGYRYKLTYDTADGTTTVGYNSNGTGYKTIMTTRPSEGFLSKSIYGEWGYLPTSTTNGTSSTYYADYYYSGNGYSLFGGSAYSPGSRDGAYYVGLNIAFSSAYWYIGAALSCKPLA